MCVAQGLEQVRAGQSTTTALEAVVPPLRPGRASAAVSSAAQPGAGAGAAGPAGPQKPADKVDALLCTALALVRMRRKPLTPPSPWSIKPCKRPGPAGWSARPALSTPACAAFCATNPPRWRKPMRIRWVYHPRWWIDKLQKQFPQDWQQILHANNQHAPMALRVQLQKISQAQYLAALAQAGIAAQPFGPQGVELAQPVAVHALPGFEQGLVHRARRGRAMGRPAAAVCALRRSRVRPRPRWCPPTHTFLMPVPHRAAKRRTCSICCPRPRFWRWRLMASAASAFTTPWRGWGCPPRWWWPMPPSPANGCPRPACSLMPSCSMPRARPQGSCAATRTCAGCAGPAISPSWPPSRAAALGGAVAAGGTRWPPAVLHLLGVSGRRGKTKLRRLLHARISPIGSLRRGICCPAVSAVATIQAL